MGRPTVRLAVALTAVLTLLCGAAVAAEAATIAVQPSSFIVPRVDDAGNPAHLTVTANGFPAGHAIFIEVCDGVSPTTLNWSPADHCDAATGNAPAFASSDGSVTFAGDDLNHRLELFKGESPQELFNCIGVNDPPTHNNLPDFSNCQIRVAETTGAPGGTDLYLPMVLPDTIFPAIATGTCTGQVGLATFASGKTACRASRTSRKPISR